MKKALILVFAALVIPSVALASKPAAPGGKGNPIVTYKLHGTLSNFTAYDSTTPANGSITILVSHANRHGKGLTGQTLTFPVDANTKIVLNDGVTAITNGDVGMVKVRAPKKIAPADLVAQIQTYSARKIIDHGAPKS